MVVLTKAESIRLSNKINLEMLIIIRCKYRIT